MDQMRLTAALNDRLKLNQMFQTLDTKHRAILSYAITLAKRFEPHFFLGTHPSFRIVNNQIYSSEEYKVKIVMKKQDNFFITLEEMRKITDMVYLPKQNSSKDPVYPVPITPAIIKGAHEEYGFTVSEKDSLSRGDHGDYRLTMRVSSPYMNYTHKVLFDVDRTHAVSVYDFGQEHDPTTMLAYNILTALRLMFPFVVYDTDWRFHMYLPTKQYILKYPQTFPNQELGVTAMDGIPANIVIPQPNGVEVTKTTNQTHFVVPLPNWNFAPQAQQGGRKKR